MYNQVYTYAEIPGKERKWRGVAKQKTIEKWMKSQGIARVLVTCVRFTNGKCAVDRLYTLHDVTRDSELA